jgi:dienelactone hydrolase
MDLARLAQQAAAVIIRPSGLSMRIAITALLALAAVSSSAGAQPPGVPRTPQILVGEAGPGGVRIDHDGVFANFYPAASRAPAVLLLGGSEGGLQPGGRGMVKALVDAGYNVLTVCYFGCPNTPPALAGVPLETFDRALSFLKAQTSVDPSRIVLVGGSKGAEAGLLVASRHPELKAVVVGMPSSVAWPGITFTPVAKPGWTEGGDPLPFLPYAPYSVMAKGGVFALYNEALPALPQHPDAAIPVERIGGRIMLVCGEADTLWPSCPMSDQIAARLKANGRPTPLVLRYADAGHAVFGTPVDRTNPNYGSLASLGGTADGNAAARADAWPKVLAFLRAAVAR